MPDEHECYKEYEWGVIKTSISNTGTDIAEIKKVQTKIFEKINGLPTKVAEQEKTIGRLWKFVYAIIFILGGGVLTAIATAFFVKL